MFQKLTEWWAYRNRKFDLKVLWPACKQLAPDLDHAKAAFAVHAFNDKAWLILGEEGIKRRIDELE